MLVFKQFLQVCQISTELEGVCGKMAKNLLIWHGINNNGRNGSFFYVAGYLIEERRRWPVITASPEDNVLNKFRILKERHVQMRKPYQSPGRMKNSSYYIAPVGD